MCESTAQCSGSPRYNCPRIRTVTCNARLDAKTIGVNMLAARGPLSVSHVQFHSIIRNMQFTVDGNKASKCDLRKIPLQKCVCAAFSVLTFVKTWRFFLTLFLGCEGIYVLTLFGLQLYPFGIWWMLFLFFWQWCVCWSWSDWRAARPQRATSGGRWPINVDLFTMVGLIAWRYSFFSFFVFFCEYTAH